MAMTDILEQSFEDKKLNANIMALDSMNHVNVNNTNPCVDMLKLDGLIEVSSAAWVTPSPSPVLCSPGRVKVVSKNCKKSTSHDDCKSLFRSVPPIRPHFKLVRKIGSGTFSNVYLATLRSLGDKSPQFALKHIFSTSHPKRIANEIKCLNEIGGSHHVIGIESCIRYKGEMVIVMPYQKHSDFMELLNNMTIENIQQYMRQLLTALHKVHQNNVVHRDVKPNNFLFDLDSQESGLVDFGLAQFLTTPEKEKAAPTINKGKDLENLKNVNIRKTNRKKMSPMSLESKTALPPRSKRRCLAEIQNAVEVRTSLKKPLSVQEKKDLVLSSKKMPRFGQSCNVENIALSKPQDGSILHDKFQYMSLTSPTSLTSRSSSKRSGSVTIADVFPSIRKYGRVKSPASRVARTELKIEEKSCNCFGKLSVCYKCLARPAANASRAGTAGFRPPEVLLRYPAQTTAVDIWSAGVIFLSLLCGRCPFFRPAEDVDSLAQLVYVFGSRKMQEVAKTLGRKLTCSQYFPGCDLRGIVMALRQPTQDDGPKLRNSPKRRGMVKGESPRKLSLPRQGGFEAVDIPDSAFDLLVQMLDPQPHTRISALRSLYHDFLITEERKTFVSPRSRSSQ